MPIKKNRRFPVVLGLFLLLGLAAPAKGFDLAACNNTAIDSAGKTKCVLWSICGFLSPSEQNEAFRLSRKVRLAPGHWAQVITDVSTFSSPWPDSITIQFFGGDENDLQLVEEMTDHGLDGLSPGDPGDSYYRYQNGTRSANLLSGLDPLILEPFGQDYLKRLEGILSSLDQSVPYYEDIKWESLAEGIETARLDVFRYIRFGRNDLLLLRFSPEFYEIVPHSFVETDVKAKLSLKDWADRVPDALAIVNSGQYFPDYGYIGMQWKNGVELGSGLHPNWKAILVSGGAAKEKSPPSTTIIDLSRQSFDPEKAGYRYALQSFMLLDREGTPRVKKTDSLASRTVIAQDHDGRMIVIFVPGACTLYELAVLLSNIRDLRIQQAMSFDGGFEAQILIRKPPENIIEYGSWVINEKRQYHQNLLRLPLPAVMAISPKKPD